MVNLHNHNSSIGYFKTTKGIIALTPDCKKTAMGLPPVMFAVFLIANFGKTWVFGGISEIPLPTPSGIKREWYVCIGYFVVSI
jgi:hypothetical protein